MYHSAITVISQRVVEWNPLTFVVIRPFTKYSLAPAMGLSQHSVIEIDIHSVVSLCVFHLLLGWRKPGDSDDL